MDFFFESAFLNALAILAVTVIGLYWYATSTFHYWRDRGVPFAKPVPFFGNISDLVIARLSFAQVFRKIYQDLEGHDCGGAFQFRSPILVVRSPELIKQVLVKDFVYFHDRAVFDNEEHDPMTANLFNLQGSQWRNLRAKLSPTFTSGKMKAMFHLLTGCGQELNRFLQDKANNDDGVDFKEALAKFSTDVIGTCAFGLEFNSMKNPDSEFRNMGRKIMNPTFFSNLNRVCILFLPGLAKKLKLTFISSDITRFFIGAVKDTVEYREANHISRNDFMDLLIQIKRNGALNENSETPVQALNHESETHHTKHLTTDNEPIMTYSQMAAQAFVFFFAGFETSSTTMSFCLYELALNPDIQAKLRAEIKNSLLKCDGHLTYEALHQLDYLDKVVSETLRKYPAVGNLVRKCTKPFTIPNTTVQLEKDTKIIIPIYGIHHDPKYYPEPDKFCPERFDESLKRERPHYTYLPFGEGPRMCIGQRFGLMQTKVGLATILSKYEVSVCRKTTVPLRIDTRTIVTTVEGGMWLKIRASP